MIKQTVIRTREKSIKYNSEYSAYSKLDELLAKGYTVIICTPIGDELEYILQKQVD